MHVALSPQTPSLHAVDSAYRAAFLLDRDPDLNHTITGPGTIGIKPEAFGARAASLISVGRFPPRYGLTLDVADAVLDGASGNGQDGQQSALIRIAGSMERCSIKNSTIQNVASDGVKFGGRSDKTGQYFARNLTLSKVRAENCGRALVVLQTGAENVTIEDCETSRMRKGAIDIEATGTELPGPRGVTIRRCKFDSATDGHRPEYVVSLGGAGGNDLALRDVLLERVTGDSGLWIRDASRVRIRNCSFSRAERYGLQLNKAVEDLWVSDSEFIGDLLGAKLSFHGTAKPKRLVFQRCSFAGDGEYAVAINSAESVVFVDCEFYSKRAAVLIQSDLIGSSVEFFGCSGIVRAEARAGNPITVRPGEMVLESQGEVYR